jgi:hypothetical protein
MNDGVEASAGSCAGYFGLKEHRFQVFPGKTRNPAESSIPELHYGLMWNYHARTFAQTRRKEYTCMDA